MREYRAIPAPRRPRGTVVLDQFDEMAVLSDLTVFEPSDAWSDTGLLDAAGSPLMRREKLGPIGFITRRDD